MLICTLVGSSAEGVAKSTVGVSVVLAVLGALILGAVIIGAIFLFLKNRKKKKSYK